MELCKLISSNYCCDPYGKHKKKIRKGLNFLSKNLIDRNPQFNLTTNHKSCTNCQIKLSKGPCSMSDHTGISASDPNLSRRLLGPRVTEEMLWEARELGAHSPNILLNTLFYFNTKAFYLKKAEDHLNLTFTQILKEWRRTKLASDVSVTKLIPKQTGFYSLNKMLWFDTMISLLKYYPVTKGNKETVAGHTYEILENKDNPLRCPVKLYEFYLSKCPESIRNDSSTYYLYPEQSCQPDSPVWFTTSSLRPRTIEKMLNRVFLVREIQDSLFSDTN